ncbi:MerR family transcriptional regulator [Saccharopolyspora indica]|uniref:MerR family transcriptional regulator n=1 Tax=Saccharopolyspora indica TaxID=1229659 RepID=UPI0022EA8842|nr:MerR family transcriptional regulator [Saccharopolyspora indica]MDA3646830.1 MerR family transcriptional regulator [Saccharopolyspora indica]
MDDELLNIGAFARQAGLTPSALRFYDDCDVLLPAHVDATTGYRYYSPGQLSRAVLLRRLRAAGVPLPEVGAVLDGTAEQARAALTAHAQRARDLAAAAQAEIGEILRSLPGGARRTLVRVGGAELASAVRQVSPSVAGAAARAEFPVLGCILVELDEEVRLVATDRYRLAVRTLRPVFADGAATGLVVDAAALADAASWALPLAEVGIEVDDRGARLHAGGRSRDLPTSDETFPDYKLILDELPAPENRVITDRSALCAALLHAPGPVVLRTDDGHLVIADRDGNITERPAVHTGPPLRIAFDPAVLVPALEAGVGPDVLLELSAPDRPVVIRSADQGSFTTLVMPVR